MNVIDVGVAAVEPVPTTQQKAPPAPESSAAQREPQSGSVASPGYSSPTMAIDGVTGSLVIEYRQRHLGGRDLANPLAGRLGICASSKADGRGGRRGEEYRLTAYVIASSGLVAAAIVIKSIELWFGKCDDRGHGAPWRTSYCRPLRKTAHYPDFKPLSWELC